MTANNRLQTTMTSTSPAVAYLFIVRRLEMTLFARRTLSCELCWLGTEMGKQMTTALYVILMAAVIVAIDFLFFKNRFWERLTVNVGTVLVFAAFYFRFLKRP